MKGLGVPCTVFAGFKYIRRGLVNAIDQPTPRVVAKVKRTGSPPRKADDTITDEVLAYMRGDYELRGMSAAEIARVYGINARRAWQLCTYVNRVHVKPVLRTLELQQAAG